jgi:hypothetical protein
MSKIKLNNKGIRDLLRSKEMVADLNQRAGRIAQAAGDGHSYEATAGRTRALASVWTTSAEAMRAEATERNLTRAIDAGR